MALVSEGASAKNLGIREGDLIFAAPDSTAWWARAPRKYSARRFKQNGAYTAPRFGLHRPGLCTSDICVDPQTHVLMRCRRKGYLACEAASLVAKGSRERLIFRDLAKTKRGRAPRSLEDRAVTSCQGATPGYTRG
jgi:hypothetical protein